MTTTVAVPARPRAEAEPVDWVGYVFVAFFTVPFLLFNIAPIFFGVYVGFTEWGIIGKPTWVGLQNFTDAFADECVAIAFKNTLLYALIIVPGVVVLGFAFALFVHQRWPLSTLARTLFFTPNVVSATVIGLVWVWVLDTQFGLVNHYLGLSRHRRHPLADQRELVADRRLHRLDLVGPRPRLRALPGRAAGRAARSLRGGRDRRRQPLAAASGTSPCRTSGPSSAWSSPCS